MNSVFLDCDVVREGGQPLLFDHGCGHLLSIKPETAAVLSAMDYVLDEARLEALVGCFSSESLQHALVEVQELIGNGFLIRRSPPFPGLNRIRLHLTDRCNLRCAYCFEAKDKIDMSLETAERAVDFLLDYSDAHEVKVIFFGGEPLLALDRMRAIVAYGRSAAARRERAIRFALSTNALLLTEEVLEELAAWDAGVLASFDGETQSQFRHSMNNKAKADVIASNIRHAAKVLPPHRLAIAATIHHENLDLVGIIRAIIALGAKTIKLTPEHTGQNPWSLTAADYAHLARQTPDVAAICRAHPDVHVAGYSFELGENGGLPYGRHCDACGGEITMDSTGNLFPCSFFIGDERFKLGEVGRTPIERGIIARLRAALDRTANPTCSGCRMRRICCGHCPYESLVLYGDVATPNRDHCTLDWAVADAKLAAYIYGTEKSAGS